MAVTKLKEFSDAILDVCKSYCSDIDTLTAERDRLAAENATLTATMGKLREVVPEDFINLSTNECDGWIEAAAIKAASILYPAPETTYEHR